MILEVVLIVLTRKHKTKLNSILISLNLISRGVAMLLSSCTN